MAYLRTRIKADGTMVVEVTTPEHAGEFVLDSAVNMVTTMNSCADLRVSGSANVPMYYVPNVGHFQRMLTGSYVDSNTESTSLIVLQNDTSGYGWIKTSADGIITRYSNELSASSNVSTLWSLDVQSATTVRAVIEAKCYAGSSLGVSADKWFGTIACLAHRNGTGSLAIDSQSACLPWILDNPVWNPQFDVVNNTLRLCLTGSGDPIKCKLTTEVLQELTTDAPAPTLHDATWLINQVNALLGSKVIDQWVTPTGTTIVTSWTGSNGNIMSNIGSEQYSIATIGTQNRAAIDAPTAIQGCLRCADVGVAIKTIVSVCEIPLFPDATNYQVLFGTGVSNSASNKTMVQQGEDTDLFNSGWTYYVNNVQTSTLTATGTIAVVRGYLESNTDQSILVGYTTAPFSWRAPTGYILACNTNLTLSEAAALQILLSEYYT